MRKKMTLNRIFNENCTCGGFRDIGRDEDANSAKFQYYCFDCKKPVESRKFILHDTVKEMLAIKLKKEANDITIDELRQWYPLFKDTREGNGECSYKPCISTVTVNHHYGFKRIFNVEDFEEANCWPVLPLCEEHHDYFHKKVEVYWKEHFVKEDA